MTDDYFDNIQPNEFNNSKISDFNICLARGYWAWVRRIRRKGTNPDLAFGTAYHEAMAEHDKYLIAGAEEIQPNEALARAQIVLQRLMEDVPEKGAKNLQTADLLLQLTINDKRLAGEVLDVEQRYEKPLIGEIVYFGKVDKRMRQGPFDIIIDYKTRSALGQYYFDNLRLDRQHKGYLWLTGGNHFLPVVALAVNKTKTYPDGAGIYLNESSPIFYVSEEELERWKWETIAIVQPLYENIRIVLEGRSGHPAYYFFPRQATACLGPWGCSFRSLCEQSCEAEEVYIDHEWWEEF